MIIYPLVWRPLGASRVLASVLCGMVLFVAGSAVGEARDVVYQDSFARKGPLAGTAPTPINETRSAWSDNVGTNGLQTDGTGIVMDKLDLAALPFDSASIPETATVTISADISMQSEWSMFGFSASNNAFDKDLGCFASVSVWPGGKVKFGKGRSDEVIESQVDDTGPLKVQISLNYLNNEATLSINGKKEGSFTYRKLPFFNQVFVHGSENSSGKVSNFSLSLEPNKESGGAMKIPKTNAQISTRNPVYLVVGGGESSFSLDWLEGVRAAIKAAGFSSKDVSPTDLGQVKLSKEAILIIHRRSDLLAALPSVLAHLRAGGALWLAGSEDFFSQSPDKSVDTSEIKRLLGGQSIKLDPQKLVKPVLTWTDAGQQIVPLKAAILPPVNAAFLSGDRAQVFPNLPPWVRVTPLLTLQYKAQNWVNLEDIFAGWVMVLLEHTDGPFKGGRVLYTGLTVDGKIFNPRSDEFYPIVSGSLQALAKPVDPKAKIAYEMPKARVSPTRENFFTSPDPCFAPLNFGGPEMNKTFWEDLQIAGYNGFHTGIPWIVGEKDPVKSINWEKLDAIMEGGRQHQKAIIIDPYAFEWFQGSAIAWGGNHSIHNKEFCTQYHALIKQVVERYKDNPAFVAIFATPHTGFGIFAVDRSDEGVQAWRNYLTVTKGWSLEEINKRYGLNCAAVTDIPMPTDTKPGEYNSGPDWGDYVAFQLATLQKFNIDTIDELRSVIPDLPILLRGGFFDVALSFEVASRYKNVAPHCECIETTSDVETYFRGLGTRFGVPYSAENGWPTVRGGPLRVNFACYLLGGYNTFLYSFGGPSWALPSLTEFARVERAADTIRQAKASYGRSDLAVMIGDTSVFAHFPQDFMSVQFLPHVEFIMEQLGFTYEAVSAQYPKWDGLRVIMDDGMNVVLTRKTAQELKEWVLAGGTFIAYSHTGSIILEGDKGGLSAILGVDVAEKGDTQRILPLGKGAVIVLPEIPKETAEGRQTMDQLFTGLKVKRDFLVEPFINQAAFAAEGKRYLVVGDKDREYLNGFFHESYLPGLEAKSQPIPLTITPQFPFTQVKNITGDEKVEVSDGKVKLTVKAHDYAVLEFTVPATKETPAK